MINVSQTIKNSCKADKNTHTEYIVINGQTIYIKGKLSATAYKDTTFFGTFNMKVLEFETENTTQFRNRQFEYYKVIDGNAFKVGTFITTEVVDNDSKGSIKVTANDYALKFAVPYTSELDYGSGEITLYDVLEECCNQVNVELENKFIDNNSFKVDSNQFVNGELVGDVICAIAGISGNFATITNEDKLRLTFTNGTGAEQTTTINGSTQINASGFKDIDLLAKTTQDGTPTPTNPVNIETTTGRNTIEVCGKNLFNKNKDIVVGKGYSSDGSIINLAETFIQETYISVESNTTYTLSTTNNYVGTTNYRLVFMEYSSDKTFIQRTLDYTHTYNTITTTSNTKYIRICASNVAINDLQLEKGTATTYEPYKGNSYEINLGKNLLNIYYNKSAGYTYTQNGITETYNTDGSITFKGTATAQTDFYITTNGYPSTSTFLYLDKSKKYTMSLIGNNANTNIRLSLGYNTTAYHCNTSTTFTPTTDIAWAFIRIMNGAIVDTTVYPQLEVGTTATSYSPYFEPIELCKIGTYQDRLFKASGKNLFVGTLYNGQIGNDGAWSSQTTRITNASQTLDNNIFIKKGTYTISIDGLDYCTLLTKDNNGNRLETYANSWNALPFTFTLMQDGYLYFTGRKSDNSTISASDYKVQIEKGSSATTYEPYGKDWYLYKEIGKVVLNGSESWVSQSYGTNSWALNNVISVNYNANEIQVMSRKFKGIEQVNRNTNDSVIYTTSNNQVYIRNTPYTTLAQVQSGMNNEPLYYVLATPTYTKIENEELIGQLDSIKTLDLFDGINNITTNAPFFLTYLDDNVEVLEDYTNLDDKRDTQPITSVSLGTSQVEGQEAILRDENLIAQYGEHWLVINDNPFGYTLEKRQQLVKAIFDKVKGFGYSSFKSEYSYRPYLELGDKIKFKNKNGDLIDSAILRYDFNFDNCTFEAPSITSATIDYELSPDANELAKRAEIIANQAEASITSITQELQIDEDGNSQVIESIKTAQTQNSLDIEAITSYQEIDGERVLTGVKTGKGFTFNNSGLIITDVNEENTYKTKIDETGTYYYDDETILGQTTNEGSKFKNMDLYGEFHYGMGEITDKPLFVSMKFSETNNGTTEQCFGHFWDGD